jgi:hypothetical protein
MLLSLAPERRGGVRRSREGVVDIELYAQHPLGPAGHSPVAARQGSQYFSPSRLNRRAVGGKRAHILGEFLCQCY